jgi:aldose sugar dehydrogenase
MKISSCLSVAAMCLGAPLSVVAQENATGAELYQQACASCHGANLQGGQAQSLADAVWQFGAGRGDILRNVKHGIPDFSMPAFETALTDSQINRIIDFLKESERTSGISKPPPPSKITSLDYEVAVNMWVKEGLNLPWGITFAKDGRAFVTERGGKLRVINNGKLQTEPIQRTPPVLAEGQGGLLDVALDPQFAENGWVYLSYSHVVPGKGERPDAMTRLVRGRVRENTWVDQHVVFEAPVETYHSTRHHYGSRIVFDRDGYLYLSIGDRGQPEYVQNPGRPNGKVHRLSPDGSIPKDNPFLGHPGALPSVFSYGHRNPQGLAVDPRTGKVWESEHGPMGGDELNLLIGGRNYGWPLTSYGRDYSGAKISDFRERPGIESPVFFWNPSPAVCGMEFVTGSLFPRWRHKLIVGALKYEELHLVTIQHDRVLHQEILLKNAGRVRDVACGPDGAVYVVLNGPDMILRLTPLRDVNEAVQ